MTNVTRIASLGLVALLASTSLTSALERTVQVATVSNVAGPILVDVQELPVPVDTYEPPIDVQPHVEDDHDVHDIFDNGPIPDDHDISDIFVDDDKVVVQDVADQNLLLSCKVVDGKLVIKNDGDTIPEGTRVMWKALGQDGVVTMPFDLRHGQKAAIEVTALGAQDGKCTAVVVF